MRVHVPSVEFVVETPHIHQAALFFIAYYYGMSAFAIWGANKKENPADGAFKQRAAGILKKGAVFDRVNSGLIVIVLVLFILTLLFWSSYKSLDLVDVICFYFYFVFLFAFLYCAINWEWPTSFGKTAKDDWAAELGYLVVSIQSQTTLGYTRMRPNNKRTELVSAFQSLIGVGFVAVIVAKAITFGLSVR